MSVLDGGREKADTEDLGYDDPNLRQLKTAKKSAVAVLGMVKFLGRDAVLSRRIAFVPAKARDGVRALEYIEWAGELVETSTAAEGAAGHAAGGGPV